MQDMSATASRVWSAMPSMRFGSATSKAVKVAKAEGKAASTSEGVGAGPGRCRSTGCSCWGSSTRLITAVYQVMHPRHVAWRHASAEHNRTPHQPDTLPPGTVPRNPT